jgi:hypothetical protein
MSKKAKNPERVLRSPSFLNKSGLRADIFTTTRVPKVSKRNKDIKSQKKTDQSLEVATLGAEYSIQTDKHHGAIPMTIHGNRLPHLLVNLVFLSNKNPIIGSLNAS